MTELFSRDSAATWWSSTLKSFPSLCFLQLINCSTYLCTRRQMGDIQITAQMCQEFLSFVNSDVMFKSRTWNWTPGNLKTQRTNLDIAVSFHQLFSLQKSSGLPWSYFNELFLMGLTLWLESPVKRLSLIVFKNFSCNRDIEKTNKEGSLIWMKYIFSPH